MQCKPWCVCKCHHLGCGCHEGPPPPIFAEKQKARALAADRSIKDNELLERLTD